MLIVMFSRISKTILRPRFYVNDDQESARIIHKNIKTKSYKNVSSCKITSMTLFEMTFNLLNRINPNWFTFHRCFFIVSSIQLLTAIDYNERHGSRSSNQHQLIKLTPTGSPICLRSGLLFVAYLYWLDFELFALLRSTLARIPLHWMLCATPSKV